LFESRADEESRQKAADKPRLKSDQEAMLRAEEDTRRKTEEGVRLTQEVQQKSKEAKVKSEEVANLKAALEAVERTYDLSASIDDVLESNTTTSSMQSYLSGLERMQARSDKDSSTMPSSQGSNLDDLAKQDELDNADSNVTRLPPSS
jgi:membrane protein involved in colicin uptake